MSEQAPVPNAKIPKRAISGFIILDKPLDMSSNQALQRVKRLLQAKKAGHTGSLDPLATGVLPLCLGEGTKLSQYLLDADKTYEMVGQLGIQTTTGDAEGEVAIEAPVPADWLKHLPKVLEQFMGESQQIPSMFSAIKQNGVPLYELARQGIEVPREPRTIHIRELVCLETTDTTFRLRVRCSKGTYVRTLVEDIAKALGTVAYVTFLRRTNVGPYQEGDMVTFEALEQALETGGFEAVKAFIRPLESALSDWPAISLTTVACHYMRQGQAIRLPNLPESGYVRMLSEHQRLIGLGEITEDGLLAPKRLICETS
jgi:tRNA pseudouridine55 synthase